MTRPVKLESIPEAQIELSRLLRPRDSPFKTNQQLVRLKGLPQVRYYQFN